MSAFVTKADNPPADHFYCVPVCEDCGSLAVFKDKMVCPHCGGKVQLVHAPNTEEGQKLVENQVKEIQRVAVDKAARRGFESK